MNKDELLKQYPEMPKQFLDTVNKAVSEELKKDRKVIRMKKKIFLVLAATLACGVTAIAAGKAVGLVGHSNAFSEFTEADEIKNKDVGFDFKHVESFQNGYKFVDGHTSDTSAVDDNGVSVEDYKNINLSYEGEKGKLYFIANDYSENDGTEDGVISAKTDCYKYIPDGYEMTEQDIEYQESGKYIFSTGDADMEVTVVNINFVTWHEDGVNYTLMQYGNQGSLTLDEMTEMAQEIMAQ